MTIEEYLKLGRTLRQEVESKSRRVDTLMERVLNPGTHFDEISTGRRSDNGHETRLIAYMDASKEYKTIYNEYQQHQEQLENALYNVLYWQALVIERVYYTNALMECPNELYGVGDILKTDDRHKIKAKLTEAKTALAEKLRAQGVEIERGKNEQTNN